MKNALQHKCNNWFYYDFLKKHKEWDNEFSKPLNYKYTILQNSHTIFTIFRRPVTLHQLVSSKGVESYWKCLLQWSSSANSTVTDVI